MFADGDTAFNAANRIRGLREVKENFPAAWYHGLPDNIKPVFCRNGYHQGDVMTIQPLLVHIKAMIQSKFPDEWFFVKFYVDDGNFIAPSKIMREIIKILQNSYDTFGSKLKSDKGCYLLGKCEDNQRAETRLYLGSIHLLSRSIQIMFLQLREKKQNKRME